MKPFAVYLLVLSSTTAGVIMAGAWCASEPRTSTRSHNVPFGTVSRSHGVRRVLASEAWELTGTPGPGLALSSSNMSRSKTTAQDVTVRAQGVRSVREAGAPDGRPPSGLPGRYFEVTAYSHFCTLPRSGKEGPARAGANGVMPTPNWTIAAPKSIPFGSVLELSHAGIVTTRIVGDRGHAITEGRLDLFVSDCSRARSWGRRRVWVRILSVPLGAL